MKMLVELWYISSEHTHTHTHHFLNYIIVAAKTVKKT